jgi:hypothetical protein
MCTYTPPTVLARVRVARVSVQLAVVARHRGGAVTEVGTHSVYAITPVLARVGAALVHVLDLS